MADEGKVLFPNVIGESLKIGEEGIGYRWQTKILERFQIEATYVRDGENADMARVAFNRFPLSLSQPSLEHIVLAKVRLVFLQKGKDVPILEHSKHMHQEDTVLKELRPSIPSRVRPTLAP